VTSPFSANPVCDTASDFIGKPVHFLIFKITVDSVLPGKRYGPPNMILLIPLLIMMEPIEIT
jgi:hypothetical protein